MTAARRSRTLVALLLGLLATGVGAAFGFWAVTTLYDSGSHALARADSLSAPTAPTAAANGTTSVTVGWTLPASQLTGAQYQVTRTSGPGSPATVCTVAPTATSCQDTGLTAGTAYGYAVRATLQSWQSSAVTASATTQAAATPNPTVASTSPSSRGRGATSQNITVNGTNFVSGAAVTFSATGITVNSTTFVTATQLTANITVSASATTGAGNVTVTNPDAGTGACTNCFTVNAAPAVTSVAPSSADKNASHTGIRILGSNFVSGATVTFTGGATNGITVTSTTFVGSGEIQVNITIASNASQSARNVTVTNPDAGVGTGSGVFTVTN